MNPCDASATMQTFATAKLEELVATCAGLILAAAQDANPDAVHDMRVSIRRLQQGFRVFEQYLPKRAVRKVRRQLKRVMECAGELRNYDVIIPLVEHAGGATADLQQQRLAAHEALSTVLKETASPDLLERWRSQLELAA